MMSDLYMDSTISDLASELVDKYGGNLTEQLVEHMKLSYGISDDAKAVAAADTGSQTGNDQDTPNEDGTDNKDKAQEV